MSDFIITDMTGTGLLCLDYSGTPPNGLTTDRIDLNLQSDGSFSFALETVFWTDGSSTTFALDGYNLFDITGSAGNDVVEFAHQDNVQIIDGGAGIDSVGFDAGSSNVAFNIDINSTTDEFVSIEQFFGSLGNADDTARLGFAVSNITGDSGIDFLEVDYSGSSPTGQAVDRIELNLQANGNFSFAQERVFFTDGTSTAFQLDSFEVFDVTGTAGDDIIEFLHEDNIQNIDGGAGIDLVGFDGGSSNVAFSIDIDSTTDQFESIEQFFGSLGNADDTVRLGFAVSNLTGDSGTDFLEVDYSRPAPSGQAVERVDLNFQANGNFSFAQERVIFTDGTSTAFQLDSFELFNVTMTAGDDIVEFAHEDDIQLIDGGNGLDLLGFDGGSSNVVFDIDIDSTTDQFVSIEQFFGSLGNANDTARLGFALNDLSGDSGTDILEVDYGRAAPDGKPVERVDLNFQANGSFSFAVERVFFTDGTSTAFQLDNFESFEVTTTDGDDVIEFAHETNVINVDGGNGLDLVGFDGGSSNVAFDIDIDSTTDQFVNIEQFFGTLSNADDTARLGFAVNSLNGDSGSDLLVVNYNRAAPSGQTASRVDLNFQANGNLSSSIERVFFTDGTSSSFQLDNFEVFNVVTTNGDDIIEFAHADNVQRVNGRGGLDSVGFSAGQSNVAFDIDIDSTTDQFVNIEQFFGTLGNADDTVRIGFATSNLNGDSGFDFLALDYGRPAPNVQSVTGVTLNLDTNGTISSARESVSFADGTTTTFQLDNFERFDVAGSNGDDEIITAAGNDSVTGGGGNDVIELGAGNDIAFGQGRNDTIRGGEGRDEISGGSGADELFGDDGADEIDGDSGADVIDGGAGNDDLFGGNAADILNGGTGNDLLNGEGFTDTLNGGGGADTLNGGGGGDILNGDGGADQLFGNNAGDTLNGGSGNDFLNGGAANDELRGGIGDDELLGSTGNDSLYGDAGADVFAFRANHGVDRIFDFEDGIDVIQFNVNGVDDISDLTLTDVFAGVDIDYGSGTIRVLNTDASDLTNADFVFV